MKDINVAKARFFNLKYYPLTKVNGNLLPSALTDGFEIESKNWL